MNWPLVGWIFLGFSAAVLIFLSILFRYRKGPSVRNLSAVQALRMSQTASMEGGQSRQVVLGDQFWSRLYPGLGLHALSLVPSFLDPESIADGSLTLSGGDGCLVLFANQVVQSRYQDGFSSSLASMGVRRSLPGATPLSSITGLLPELTSRPYGSLALFGNSGPVVLLLAEAVRNRGGHVFAATGTLAAQAALFLSIRDLLIGETIFMLPELASQETGYRAAWLAEDILRVLLMISLIAGVILKMVGVL